MPKLLLTLDHKRLSSQDNIKEGQLVLIHCTPSPDRKFEKAVLARITKIFPSRDGANRVVEVSYFKSKDCKLKDNKLIGKTSTLIRGLETLSQLSQEALDPCKIRKFLKHQCNPPQDQISAVEKETDQTSIRNIHEEQETLEEESHPQEVHEIPTIESLDPADMTTVWTPKEGTDIQENITQNQYGLLDDQQTNNKTQVESVQLGKTLDLNLKVLSFLPRDRVKCGGLR